MKLIFSVPGTSYKFVAHHSEKTLRPKDKKNLRLQLAQHLPGNLIPFHACLVKSPDCALIISGASESGKTSLADALTKSGYRILANDFIAVWEKNNKLLAADLNLQGENKNKQAVQIDKVICLEPNDCRDWFGYSYREFVEHYCQSLEPLTHKQLRRYYSRPIFKKLVKLHSVLGNRQSVERSQKVLNTNLDKTPPSKIGVIGMGTIGEEISSLLLNQEWLNTLNIFSPNQKKLSCQILDLKSACPLKNITSCSSFLKAAANSDLLVLSFKSSLESLVDYQDERMKRLAPHIHIIWKQSRWLRKINFSGKILVITNPVDILSWAVYYFSNLNNNYKLDWKGLSSSQIIGIGLGLDYSRLNVLTKMPLEVIGEHNQNIIFAQKKQNKLVRTNQKIIHNKVVNFSPRIRQHVKRTKFGPAHEALRVINTLHSRNGTLRVSSLNQKSAFLGNIFHYHNSLTPLYEFSAAIQEEFDKRTLQQLALQQTALQIAKDCNSS